MYKPWISSRCMMSVTTLLSLDSLALHLRINYKEERQEGTMESVSNRADTCLLYSFFLE